MRHAVLSLLLLSAVSGCGDNFAEVQRTDTIAAYEHYLAENPDGRWELQATSRLETLYLEKAQAEKTLEAFDVYLEKFPEGALRARALDERESFLFRWARSENTAASWDKFLEEYPKAKKDNRRTARRMVEVHSYLPHLEVDAPNMERVNLAEDPDGPLDGWGFQVMVTNNGERTIESLHMTIDYLGDEGRALESREWPLVAPFWKTPIEEERKVPMKPGETRPWDWTTGAMPDGWTRRVRVYPSRITFLDE